MWHSVNQDKTVFSRCRKEKNWNKFQPKWKGYEQPLLCGVHRMHEDGSSFTWHQPCNNPSLFNSFLENICQQRWVMWGVLWLATECMLHGSEDKRFHHDRISIWEESETVPHDAFGCLWGVRIVLWLECRTHDQKVVCTNPGRSSGRSFFSRVNFLCWLLFWYLFHPCITTVACERFWPFCQNCRGQVTAKHAWTIYVCGFTRSDMRCSFMWHQPCNNQTML